MPPVHAVRRGGTLDLVRHDRTWLEAIRCTCLRTDGISTRNPRSIYYLRSQEITTAINRDSKVVPRSKSDARSSSSAEFCQHLHLLCILACLATLDSFSLRSRHRKHARNDLWAMLHQAILRNNHCCRPLLHHCRAAGRYVGGMDRHIK